jgi:ferrous iron transport protein B
MELPPYRMPTFRSTLKHMWSKGSQYLNKMGGVILVASILLWTLSYFPRKTNNPGAKIENQTKLKNVSALNSPADGTLNSDLKETMPHQNGNFEMQQLENSYIGRLGKFVEPVLAPLGFNWEMGVSLLSGIAAKEIIVSTLGVLHHEEIHKGKTLEGLSKKIQNEKYISGENKGNQIFTPLATISFLLFILIYFPCIAVFAAVKKESGSIKWAMFMVFYTTALAYLVSLTVYQSGAFIMKYF